MKVLHVITSLRTGGAESLIAQIVPLMCAEGIEVEVALFDGTETAFKRQLSSSGVKIHDFSIGGAVYNPLNILRLRKLMSRFDIVHTHNTAPQLFAAIGSVLCSVVLCTTEHNTTNRRRDLWWYAPIDRWMYNRYRHVICISPDTETNLIKSLKTKKVPTSVIYNGIDIVKYRDAPPTALQKTTDGCRIALMQVAGFRYQKDQDTVIKSLCYLDEDIHLYLVGDGDRRKELEVLVTAHGLGKRVHFLGIREDVPQLLRATDIVVMSSHWEGFGLAAVEGMAAGKPVLASDVEGLRDVVAGAGILFAHGDPKALADKINELLADRTLYDDRIRLGRLRAENFDIHKMVEGYIGVYDSLMRDRATTK